MKHTLIRRLSTRKPTTTKGILANAQKTLAAAKAQQAEVAQSLHALREAYPVLKAKQEPQQKPAPAAQAKQAEANTRRHLDSITAPKPSISQRLASLFGRK